MEYEYRTADLNGLQDCTGTTKTPIRRRVKLAGVEDLRTHKILLCALRVLVLARYPPGPIRAGPPPLLEPHLDAEPSCSGNIVQRVSTCFVCFKHWSKRGRDDDPTVNRNENYRDRTQDTLHNSKRHKGIMSKLPREVQIITLQRSPQSIALLRKKTAFEPSSKGHVVLI